MTIHRWDHSDEDSVNGSIECSTDATAPDECSMMRERSVAGISNDVPDCPVHGAFVEQQA